MKKTQQKKFILLAFFIELFLVSLIFYLFYRIQFLQNEQVTISDNHGKMIEAADQLRQSSDDLTHFARTYVVTNDLKFKKRYQTTLDIRNGKQPRPYKYEHIYWDLNQTLRDKRHPKEIKLSLQTIFDSLPFTQEELSLLLLSEQNSNELVSIETDAFNAMEGGGSHREGMNHQALAIKLLHSDAYYSAKQKIMDPIDQFMRLLDNRISDEIGVINQSISIHIVIAWLLFFLFIIFNSMVIVLWYKKERKLNNMLENQVKIKTKQLVKQKERAELAVKIKSEFLANMSHEIRTPMNAIIGMTDLALEGEIDNKQKNYVNKANIAAKNLLHIINDILDFSKIEAGKLHLEAVHFELKDIINQTLELNTITAKEKNLRMKVKLHSNVPKFYYADAIRLGQVLTNLLNNAVKFSFRGGSIILEIAINEETDKDALIQFSLTDEGVGISPSNQTKLFKSFSQAESSTTRRFGGTGLGLVISKEITKLMSGDIWVKSEEGKGSTFTFTVRMQKSDQDELIKTTQDANKSMQLAIDKLQGHNILLVEDNDLNQELAKDLLERNGLKVTIANNGQEALEVLETQLFDLVLMDIQMPVMDGYEATRKIRAEEKYKKLPIIAMTANVMNEDICKAKEAGMNDHIGKPINPTQMFSTMSKWVKQ